MIATKKDIEVLQLRLGRTTSYLERYHVIDEFTDRHGDMWIPEMGEDALDYFCPDCASLLPLDRLNELCDSCEENYQELWG